MTPGRRAQFVKPSRGEVPILFDPIDARTAAEAKRRARAFKEGLRRHLDARGLLWR
jgi:hypothetical protein